MPKRFRWTLYVIGVVTLVLLAMRSLSIWVDYLWFDALGYRGVFVKIITTRIGLFAAVAALFFVWLYLHFRLARRPIPKDISVIGRRLLPPAEREVVERYADKVLLIVAVVIAIVVGLLATNEWANLLTFKHGVPFGGDADPVFHKDAGFYIFRLPFLQFLNRTAFTACLLALLGAGVVYVYEESLRFTGSSVFIASHVRTHLFALGALALVVKAWSYRLAAYALISWQHGELLNAAGLPLQIREGAGPYYADVQGRLPVLAVLVFAALVCAVIVAVSAKGRGLKVPGYALAGLIILSFLGQTAYPALLQRLVVEPSKFTREKPYIERNIAWTNRGFGLTGVDKEKYPGDAVLTAASIRDNPLTIRNIRLWDDRPLEKTFNAQQELRRYYDFIDVDIDRYHLDDQYQQVMLSARQLDPDQIPAEWVNQRLLYTHGFGIVMAPVNRVGPEGFPEYLIKDIPPRSLYPELQIKQPRLYYMAWVQKVHLPKFKPPAEGPAPGAPEGEAPPAPEGQQPSSTATAARETTPPRKPPDPEDYVLVNTDQDEFDYPLGEKNMYTKYTGHGGIVISSFMRRLALFTKFMDLQILFTSSIGKDSRALINRFITRRASVVAPFLLPDLDPYIIVHKGRLVWMLDCYTFSNRLPYSTVLNLGRGFGFNYIRNSVKATVDAYDGTLDLYIADPTDPIVRTWAKIFPGLLKDMRREMPPELLEHIRYPQFYFMCQAWMYADYHMRDPQVFFNREDRWSLPVEVYQTDKVNVEPYYVVMKLPGEAKAEFIQMLPMTPTGKEEQNMIAWLAGRCDGKHYGKLRVFVFPKERLFYGPMQIEARVDQDTDISREMSLWGGGGSRVLRGNLLVIPINGSLLYVEPLYLEAEQTQIPQLKRVIVAYGDRVTMQPSLDEALDAVFGAGAAPRGTEATPLPGGEAVAAPPAETGPPTAAADRARLRSLIRRALDLDAQSAALLKQGDFAGFDAKRKELKQVLEELNKLSARQ